MRRGKADYNTRWNHRRMVTPGRLELPTRSLGNCCSIHLSYGATFRINNLTLYLRSGSDHSWSPSGTTGSIPNR